MSKTITSRLAALKKFYITNDIELKWKKIMMYVGNKRRRTKDRPYTHYEISKMLEKADQRTRVVILLMCSSGIRVGGLPSLKIRNLEKIDKYNRYKITVYEGDDEEYITFCTPECSAAIDSYLEYRQRYGERPIKDDAPLIREQFDIYDELVVNPKPLTDELFKYLIWRTARDAGILQRVEYTRTLRHPVKSTHGFRKFFQTTAIHAGMSPLYAEMLMGHGSGGLALESYVRPPETDLLEGNDKMIGYSGVIDALTIKEENKLRRKVETLMEKQDEIQKMKDKHEYEMKTMREEMENKFQQILAKIDTANLT